MTDQQNTASTTVSATVVDSGPGPLDVLEARITIETRNALDTANRAVERLVAFLERDPRPQPHEVGRMCSGVAEEITRALTVARTLGVLGGDW